MQVDFDIFSNWAKIHFDDVKIKDKEVKLNSIFTDDQKNHLWCCPKKGTYHCWKTGKGGTLVQLVSLVESCSFDRAKEILNVSNDLSILESKFRQLFGNQEKKENIVENKIKLPPHTHKISSLPHDNHHRMMAERYLFDRKLSINNLMVCVSGEYANRIVIPYFGLKNELIYWNSRDITNNAYLRYCGPKKEEVGCGKEDVLWFHHWPGKGSRVHLTEGEFDAMSLNEAGFTAGACGGKNVGDKQLALLKPYKISICFDADKSGKEALNKVGNKLLQEGFEHVKFIRPAKGYKDWNEMLVKVGLKVMKAYIEQNEMTVDSVSLTTLNIFSW